MAVALYSDEYLCAQSSRQNQRQTPGAGLATARTTLRDCGVRCSTVLNAQLAELTLRRNEPRFE